MTNEQGIGWFICCDTTGEWELGLLKALLNNKNNRLLYNSFVTYFGGLSTIIIEKKKY